MTNAKEYTEKELETKLDSLMNEDDNWLDDCFGNMDADNEAFQKVKEERAYEATRYQPCGKCNGKGKISHYHYVSGGVCFACDGAGKIYK